MPGLLLAMLLPFCARPSAAAERTLPGQVLSPLARALPGAPKLAVLPDAAIAPALDLAPGAGVLTIAPGLDAAPAAPGSLDMSPGLAPEPLNAGAVNSLDPASPLAELESMSPGEPRMGTDPDAPLFDGRLTGLDASVPAPGQDLSSEYHAARSSLKAVKEGRGAGLRAQDLADLREYKILFVPGFLSGAFIKLSKAVGQDPKSWHYFGSQASWLTKLGVEHELVGVHTEQTVEHNSAAVARAIAGSSKPVIIISHSKGGLDTLHALESLPERALAKVAGWIPVQSPFLGSPGADRVVEQPLAHYWISRFLEHPTVGGSRESLSRMTTKAAERYYLSRRRRIARILERVPTVAFTSWKQLGFMNLLGELTHLGMRLNPFLNPWLLWSPLFGLALILKGVAGSLSWLSRKSDGLVPAERARLPGMDFVEEEGVDHFAPFVDHGGTFDRLEFTQALLQMVLKRIKARVPPAA